MSGRRGRVTAAVCGRRPDAGSAGRNASRPARLQSLGEGRTPAAMSGGYPRPLDVVDDVLNRLEILQLTIGDLDAELVLSGNRDLDHGKRIDVQVVDEALGRSHLVCWHPRDLVDDLAEALEDLLLRHGHNAFSPLVISYRS